MRALLVEWGRQLIRPLVAGLLLVGIEACLVIWIGGELFLGGGEVLGYLAAALPLLVAVSVTLWAAGSAVLRVAGAAGRVDRDHPVGQRARRAGAAAAVLLAPAAGVSLWAITEGRRLRDLPGRPLLVGLAALSVGALMFWVVARLVRKARAGELRDLRMASAFAAGVALAALVADATVLRRLYPSLHWTLASISVFAALLAAATWPERMRGRLLVAAAVLVAFVAAPLSLVMLREESNASYVVERTAPLTGKTVRVLRRGRATLDRASAPTPTDPPPIVTEGIDLRGHDVLLLTIDALRADRLAALGGEGMTPALDALAADAAVFRRAYTPTPETSYAIGSLLTGKYLRAAMDLPRPAADHTTLPELLARNGYQTAAFYPPAILFVDQERFAALDARALGFAHREVGFVGADARVEQVAAWLRSAAPDAPVFVWAHFFEPHEPYDPPDGAPEGASLEERYDGEVAAADRALRDLVAAFRRERPGATVIVTADHGEELGDHGGHYHGTTLYDEQVRVPLVWSSPGVVPAGVYDVPIDLPDLATTLLSALGVPRGDRMRGDDLGPVLAGHDDLGPSYAFAAVGDEQMATDGRLKAICVLGASSCRLYDLGRDPEERRNLGPDRPEDVGRLRGALSEHLASIPAGELGAESADLALSRAEIGDPSVGPDLVPLLGSESPRMRARAARGIGRIGHVQALPVLARLRSEDPDERVRAVSAIAALRLGDDEALPQVRDLVRAAELDDRIARSAALALGERGEAAATPVLIAIARDEEAHERDRAHAVALLGELRARPAVGALLELLADLRLRTRAAVALGRIGDRRAGWPLVQALEREPYVPARIAEAEALAILGERRAVPVIERHLGAPTPLPGGVGFLVELGALRAATARGAELARASRARDGAWECTEPSAEAAGCAPGEDAAIVLPASRATRGEARAIVRVAADRDGDALALGGVRRPLRRGVQEVAFDLPAGDARRRLEIAADGSVTLIAIAVVPRVAEPGVETAPPEGTE